MSEERGSSGIDEVMERARLGDRVGARHLALALVQQNPNDVVALLWLAYTTDKLEEVQVVLDRVLEIEPGNEKALEWQEMLRQKQSRPRTSQTGPLMPVPPTPPTIHPNPAPAYRPPALNPASSGPRYIQPQTTVPQTGPLNPNPFSGARAPQPYQPPVAPVPYQPQTGQYRVVVEPGPTTSPARPYVQPYEPPKKRRWWLVALLGVIPVLLLAGLVVWLLVLRSPGTGNLTLAEYRLFSSVDELATQGFVDERVAIEQRFMGGYTKDAQGTYLLQYGEGRNLLIVQWHESITPLNDFRPGQFITIYGRITGISGGKITLKADKVTLTNS